MKVNENIGAMFSLNPPRSLILSPNSLIGFLPISQYGYGGSSFADRPLRYLFGLIESYAEMW